MWLLLLLLLLLLLILLLLLLLLRLLLLLLHLQVLPGSQTQTVQVVRSVSLGGSHLLHNQGLWGGGGAACITIYDSCLVTATYIMIV